MPTSASTSLAHAGNFVNFTRALHINSQQPWIIDSRATDHMTSFPIVFYTYNPFLGKDKVKTADGNLSSISGKGVTPTSNSLPLSSIIHVSPLSTIFFPLAE